MLCCATSTCFHLQLLPCMGKSEKKADNCCYHWQSFQENWWLNKRSLKFLAHVDISEGFTRTCFKVWDFLVKFVHLCLSCRFALLLWFLSPFQHSCRCFSLCLCAACFVCLAAVMCINFSDSQGPQKMNGFICRIPVINHLCMKHAPQY